jgi:hypothetical protein
VPGLAALHLLNDGGEVGGDMVGAEKGGWEVRGKKAGREVHQDREEDSSDMSEDTEDEDAGAT